MTEDAFIEAARRLRAVHQRQLAEESIRQAVAALDAGHEPRRVLRSLVDASEHLGTPAPPSRGLRLVQAGELGSQPPVRWLVESEIPEAATTVLYGPSGAGKSFITLDYTARIAQGQPVAYIAGEGAGGYPGRLAAWRSYHSAEADNLAFIFDQVNLMNGQSVDTLIDALAPHAPALVVIDTLAQTMLGGDENSPSDMGLYLANCRRLTRELGAAVLVVHHTGKNSATGALSIFDGKGAKTTQIADAAGLATATLYRTLRAYLDNQLALARRRIIKRIDAR